MSRAIISLGHVKSINYPETSPSTNASMLNWFSECVDVRFRGDALIKFSEFRICETMKHAHPWRLPRLTSRENRPAAEVTVPR